MKKTILITGSGGLIGSQAVKYFSEKGYSIVGIDDNHRKYFLYNSLFTYRIIIFKFFL